MPRAGHQRRGTQRRSCMVAGPARPGWKTAGTCFQRPSWSGRCLRVTFRTQTCQMRRRRRLRRRTRERDFAQTCGRLVGRGGCGRRCRWRGRTRRGAGRRRRGCWGRWRRRRRCLRDAVEDAGCLERGHSRSASVRVGRTSLMNYGFLFLFTMRTRVTLQPWADAGLIMVPPLQ